MLDATSSVHLVKAKLVLAQITLLSCVSMILQLLINDKK